MTEDAPKSESTAPAGYLIDLRLALGFLSRFPVAEPRLAAGRLGRASRSFPAAGLAIGATGALAYALAAWLGLPAIISSLLGLAVLIWITRGLHEDGLADFADGIGQATPAARLEVMRDSRVGTFGALALLLSLGLRATALAALGEPEIVARVWIAAAVASRLAIALGLAWLPPARADGLLHHAGRPEPGGVVVAAATGVALTFLLLPWGLALAGLIVAGVGAGSLGRLAKSKLGGGTGDVLGAGQQVAEIGFLLAIVAALR